MSNSEVIGSQHDAVAPISMQGTTDVPFALQITSLIIHRRAEFLAHSGCVFADLIELSADYDKYGRLLAELSGVPTPSTRTLRKCQRLSSFS